jgi:MFS family permease
MYRLDWIEQLKLGNASLPGAREVAGVHPVVWRLGVTSLLTDVSAEMVGSLLPVYAVLHLHLSPLEYGAIDGIYNGVALALFGLAGGLLADRRRRYKEVATLGYSVSAICKLLLIAAGAAWGWIAAVVALDRAGKGVRTAPRDAIISLSSRSATLATSFAVHRALDAGGSLLGPILAFAILTRLPGAYDAVWVSSFAFALLGAAVLWLFVDNPAPASPDRVGRVSIRAALDELARPGFRRLVAAGTVLSVATISDGFLYLLLRERSGLAPGFFPLFYVMTACSYLVLSIPAGRIADRCGRRLVLLAGYVTIAVLYGLLLAPPVFGAAEALVCLLLFGFHYAATEGVLLALASQMVPADVRSSGLAILATCIGLAKMASSLIFGWLWTTVGTQAALFAMGIALAGALVGALRLLGQRKHEEQA